MPEFSSVGANVVFAQRSPDLKSNPRYNHGPEGHSRVSPVAMYDAVQRRTHYYS